MYPCATSHSIDEWTRVHSLAKASEAEFRARCVQVKETSAGLWGDCPGCGSTLFLPLRRNPQAGHILPELALWLLAMAFLLCLCAVLGSMARCQQTAMDYSHDPLPQAWGADPPRDSRFVVLGRWLSNEVQP